MNPRLRSELVPLALVAITVAMAVWIWPSTPDRVPIHFGLDGRPDGWGDKATGILVFPAVAAFLYLLTLGVSVIVRRVRGEWAGRPSQTIRVAALAFVPAMFAGAMPTFRGAALNMNGFVLPLLGALLLVIGYAISRMWKAAPGQLETDPEADART